MSPTASSQESEMVECQVILYYKEEPADPIKNHVVNGVREWSRHIHGKQLVTVQDRYSSWLHEFSLWLPDAIASGIIGWVVAEGLTAAFLSEGGDNLLPPGTAYQDQGGGLDADDHKGIVTVPKHQSLQDATSPNAVPELDELAGILRYIGSEPNRITFVVWGQEGRQAKLIDLNRSSSHAQYHVGPNSEIRRYLTRTERDLEG